MPSAPKWLKRQFNQFDLLLDYFNALARRWQDLLFGESVLAVVFLLAWGFDKLSENGLALIFVVAMFVAGYYAWRADYVRLLPKLCVDPSPRSQGSPTVGPGNNPTGFSTNYQLVIKGLTDVPVENCRGHLLYVLRFVAAGIWVETEINEALAIQWTIGANTVSITLFPGVPQRLNVFFAHSDGNTLLSTVPLPMRSMGVLNRIDLFRFFIRITATDCESVDVVLECRVGTNPADPEVLRLVDATQAALDAKAGSASSTMS